jgi:CRISPR type III-A-associated protein Csm2
MNDFRRSRDFHGGGVQRFTVDEAKLTKILDGEAKELVKYAEELGSRFAPQNRGEKKTKLSSSQIRNVLDNIQRMEYDINQLQRLRPKLAYTAGKNKESASLQELQQILDKAIALVDSQDRFNYFREFFEAIVGYHRYYSVEKEG